MGKCAQSYLPARKKNQVGNFPMCFLDSTIKKLGCEIWFQKFYKGPSRISGLNQTGGFQLSASFTWVFFDWLRIRLNEDFYQFYHLNSHVPCRYCIQGHGLIGAAGLQEGLVDRKPFL